MDRRCRNCKTVDPPKLVGYLEEAVRLNTGLLKNRKEVSPDDEGVIDKDVVGAARCRRTGKVVDHEFGFCDRFEAYR